MSLMILSELTRNPGNWEPFEELQISSIDAIFEITLSAALGAGMARLERGLTALNGDNKEFITP